MAMGMAIFSVAMAAKQYSDSRSAAKDQEKMGRQNALAVEAETAESARRMSKQQEEDEARSRARAAASGVTASGSVLGSLERQSSENRKQLEWLKKSGTNRARLAEDEGDMSAANTRRAGSAAALSSLGSAYGYGAGKYW